MRRTASLIAALVFLDTRTRTLISSASLVSYRESLWLRFWSGKRQPFAKKRRAGSLAVPYQINVPLVGQRCWAFFPQTETSSFSESTEAFPQQDRLSLFSSTSQHDASPEGYRNVSVFETHRSLQLGWRSPKAQTGWDQVSFDGPFQHNPFCGARLGADETDPTEGHTWVKRSLWRYLIHPPAPRENQRCLRYSWHTFVQTARRNPPAGETSETGSSVFPLRYFISPRFSPPPSSPTVILAHSWNTPVNTETFFSLLCFEDFNLQFLSITSASPLITLLSLHTLPLAPFILFHSSSGNWTRRYNPGPFNAD